MAPLATSVELSFSLMHRYRRSFLPTCSSLQSHFPISLHALEFARCWCAYFWLVLRIPFLAGHHVIVPQCMGGWIGPYSLD
eukprot:Gb_02220 [translate_table: standard]